MDDVVPSQGRGSVYRVITDKIIQSIKKGADIFVMPWHRSGSGVGRPTNALTKAAYRGVNVIGLWADAVLAGYSSHHWASYQQWKRLGGRVRRGEHGTTIVLYRDMVDRDEGERAGRRLVACASTVFNAEQVDGWEPPQLPSLPCSDRIAQADAFITATGARIVYLGDLACYDPASDAILIPPPDMFRGSPTSSPTEALYSVTLHELTHWTSAEHRLARSRSGRFSSSDYTTEELVAELGAAFLCSDLGIANDPRPDHAAYLSRWLRLLASDPKAIFAAAREATRACDYLHEITR